MKPASKSFSLKDGTCVLYSDRIELEYQGIRGWWLRLANKHKLTSVGFWYVVAAAGFLVAAVFAVIIDNWFLGFFFLLFMAMSLAGSWFNRRASLRTMIPKKDITKVVFHQAEEGVSRAFFKVYFRPARSTRIRKLPLPGQHRQGTQIANAAAWMMKDEGLLS